MFNLSLLHCQLVNLIICTSLLPIHILSNLGHNVLGVLGAVHLQLRSNVRKCDSAVGKADRAHLATRQLLLRDTYLNTTTTLWFSLKLSCPQHNCDYRSLDDIVMKPNDQAVGEVGLELRGELLHHVVEPDG